MMTLGLVLAAFTGIALGLLGGGGSILTVPIFVYLLGFEAKVAIAMSLAVIGVTSLVASVGHWRAGHVDTRMALTFGSVAMVGTYLGARLAVFVSGPLQLTLFAAVMLVAAWFMLRDQHVVRPAAAAGTANHTSSGLIVVEGITVGVFTGLVGVGGGFLVVPALVLLAHLPMKQAVGTSLAVIAMKSFAGFAGYLGQVEIPWAFVGGFTAVALAGSAAGTALTRIVPAAALQRAFAVLLVITGLFVLYQNWDTVVAATAAAQERRVAAAGAGVRK